jgi:hypothetical protein
MVHSLLLSASLKGTFVEIKCAKDTVRYRQFRLDGGSFNGIGVTVNGDFSYRNDDVLGEIDNVHFTFGFDEEVIHR